MSRGYRIRVPEHSASSTVTGSDELCIEVGLLPILGEAEMTERLRAELIAAGWKPTREGGLSVGMGQGMIAELAPDGQRITVSSTTQQTVRATAGTEAEAKRLVEARTAETRQKASHQSTVRLARAETDVRAGLEQAVQRVYLGALEEKARQMGEIESVQHGTSADGTVEVTIKVRV